MISRRAALAAPLALAACGSAQSPAQPPTPAVGPLKAAAPFPVGLCAMTGQFDDPQWVAAARRNFNQITPEWEMKMERILTRTGGYDFSASDRIAAFARENGMRLYATTLIWYAQDHPWFHDLDKARFVAEYDRWIATVAGRYRGQAVGWDVVNEPVAENGDGLRDCLWSRALGQDGYMIRAFEQARAADPEAVLFLNDYNLENNPRKGATYLRTVERLLKAGAPIGGLGTQSHLDIEIPAGRITDFMRELAQFGLPIHVSELDASLRSDRRLDTRSPALKREQQQARVIELAEAFMALPPAQRFAFTVWGLRDTDSWLRRGNEDDGKDQPLLFDAQARPKPLAAAVETAFKG
ncbi:endo-1,4-beta-xylanase [Brevundimonas faecalis]|uniref:endo-1,4-beta-xylanase n=1 Tax=Brevundimonas faecalis TaxID=947378 RepID=UPI003606D46C